MSQTRDGNALLISTLDSTIRLLDKGNGKLLQSYRGHTNDAYRVNSCLGLGDSAVVSGSEDGSIYVWDVLDGSVIERLESDDMVTKAPTTGLRTEDGLKVKAGAEGTEGKGKGRVVSAVAFNGQKKEWASAGADGKS